MYFLKKKKTAPINCKREKKLLCWQLGAILGDSRKAPSHCCGNVLNFALTGDVVYPASQVVQHSVCEQKRRTLVEKVYL